MSIEQQRIHVLIAGICGLTLMLGVARFAYTPLLPLMLADASLTASQGAWMASVNYLGYLGGVLIASLISDMAIKDRLYRLGIIMACVSTLGMALTSDWMLWSILRFFAGLSSAAGLMLGSGLILNWLIRHEFRGELGIHFAGIGAGIFACALFVGGLSSWMDWRTQWLVLSGFGILLAVPAWAWLPRPENTGVSLSGSQLKDKPPGRLFLNLFMVAYFCAGVGFVVSATFIVAIVEQLPGLAGKGVWVFALIGLAAMPATVIWDLLARRQGEINALIVTYLLQVAAIALPLLSNNLALVLFSGALFGMSFVGSVSLVLTMAGHYYPSRPAKMMSKMTLSYGVAQILAPALIALVSESQGGYQFGLYFASGVMLAGTLLLLILKRLDSSHTT